MKVGFLLVVCIAIGMILIGRGCSMSAAIRERRARMDRYESRPTESEKLLQAIFGPAKISWQRLSLPDSYLTYPITIFQRIGTVTLRDGRTFDVRVEGACVPDTDAHEDGMAVNSRPPIVTSTALRDESIANLEKLGITPSFIKTAWTPYDHDAVYGAWIGVIMAGKGGMWMKWTWDNGLASGQVTHALASPDQRRTR